MPNHPRPRLRSGSFAPGRGAVGGTTRSVDWRALRTMSGSGLLRHPRRTGGVRPDAGEAHDQLAGSGCVHGTSLRDPWDEMYGYRTDMAKVTICLDRSVGHTPSAFWGRVFPTCPPSATGGGCCRDFAMTRSPPSISPTRSKGLKKSQFLR